jgi:DNA-binding PadR family transcriptional regulator
MNAMPPPRKNARASRTPAGREPAAGSRGPGGRGGSETGRGGASGARGGRSRRAGGQSPARESATREAIAQASRLGDPRETAREVGRGGGGRVRSGDPFTGELRRRDVLPLLVLHLMGRGPSYGNQLMDRISSMTEGVLSVNPNTMYPLLRSLESRELIEGNWEHPERRSRRYYSLTESGREEYERLLVEVRPFLDSIARSIDEIVREVYE